MQAAGIALLAVAAPLCAGPVEVYREGPQFCPRNRPVGAAPLTQAQAIERARALLPPQFCAASFYVSGCDVIPEYALASWRIYFHQYKQRGSMHDTGGLAHTYVILDAIGNCYANIPGTEFGARR